MRYEPIKDYTPAQVAAALARDDAATLRAAVLSAALHWAAREPAEALCLGLARHADANVRGNAVLGLGHLARRFGVLSPAARVAITAAQADAMAYVRGQAEAAQDDADTFLRS